MPVKAKVKVKVRWVTIPRTRTAMAELTWLSCYALSNSSTPAVFIVPGIRKTQKTDMFQDWQVTTAARRTRVILMAVLTGRSR